MRVRKMLAGIAMMLAVVASLAAPAGATTLIRASLNELTASNSAIVVGEVVDTYSYWNADHSFILTDVVVSTHEVIKGAVDGGEFVLTILGGTVGELTTLIVGGPELVPGGAYVLFLNDEDLPGAAGVKTVRDHCQGVYDIVLDKRGDLRAISQANGHPLMPDKNGTFDAPGGFEGFPFEAMLQSVRELTGAPVR